MKTKARHCKICDKRRVLVNAKIRVCDECFPQWEKANKRRKYKLAIGQLSREHLEVYSGNHCEICGTTPGRRSLSVDLGQPHPELKEMIRGLLCHRCFRAIRLLKSNPFIIKSLFAYMKRFAKRYEALEAEWPRLLEADDSQEASQERDRYFQVLYGPEPLRRAQDGGEGLGEAGEGENAS